MSAVKRDLHSKAAAIDPILRHLQDVVRKDGDTSETLRAQIASQASGWEELRDQSEKRARLDAQTRKLARQVDDLERRLESQQRQNE
ncbi:hypothetical protein Landi51_13965, partial [Colletotrichum acutatum]